MCKHGLCLIDCEEFKTWGRSNYLSETTLYTYARQVNVFAEWMGGESVWLADAPTLRTFLYSKGSPATRNLARSALISYGEYSLQLGRIQLNTAKALPVFACRKRLPKPFPREVMPSLIRAATEEGPMVEALIKTLAYGALRRSEARMLRWDEVSREYLSIVGKGDKQRFVVVHDELWLALQKWHQLCPSQEWCFPSPVLPDTPIGANWIYRKAIALGESVGLTHCHPHRFRHTTLTDFYRLTSDLIATRDFAGHSSTATTETYVALAADRIRRGVQQLNFDI